MGNGMIQSSVQNLFSITEVELVYRNKIQPKDRLKITRSSEAYNILLNAWDFNKIELVEQFYIVLLDRNNTVLGLSNISTGGVSACLVDPKIVFATVLKSKSSGFIMAHNHPSGNPNPSKADKDLTQRFVECAKFLDVTIPDHIIVTPREYFSFADEGLMP